MAYKCECLNCDVGLDDEAVPRSKSELLGTGLVSRPGDTFGDTALTTATVYRSKCSGWIECNSPSQSVISSPKVAAIHPFMVAGEFGIRTLWKAVWCLCLSLMAVSCAGAQGVPTVSYSLHTKDFDDSDSAQLSITGNIPANISRIHIDFVPQAKFSVQPAGVDLDTSSTGTKIITAVVKRDKGALSGDYFLIAHATATTADKGVTISFDQQINFTYTERLSLWSYVLLGLAGFGMGYLVRILTTVLKTIPVPSPAPPSGVSGVAAVDGPVTRFAKAHYYWVDLGVSLLLGFAALLYLIRDGHPPDSAAAWYGALLTGLGLGFLTNNDLMSRIKS